MTISPTHVDLFSGIGGFSLAARWAGFRTTLHCEIDAYCQKVLRKHWPEVPIHDDIKTLDGRGVGAVDLLTGGFPCQPFSVAGKRRGADDERHLWPDMLRVIAECRPTWVVGENVFGFVSGGLDLVLADLETAGYATRTYVFPAHAVGADFWGDRAFVVASAHGVGGDGGGAQTLSRQPGLSRREDVGGAAYRVQRPALCTPRLCRSIYGIPHGLDRLRALGNAVVPQQVYPLLAAIYETMGRAA